MAGILPGVVLGSVLQKPFIAVGLRFCVHPRCQRTEHLADNLLSKIFFLSSRHHNQKTNNCTVLSDLGVGNDKAPCFIAVNSI